MLNNKHKRNQIHGIAAGSLLASLKIHIPMPIWTSNLNTPDRVAEVRCNEEIALLPSGPESIDENMLSNRGPNINMSIRTVMRMASFSIFFITESFKKILM
jgi:hypothetical protein